MSEQIGSILDTGAVHSELALVISRHCCFLTAVLLAVLLLTGCKTFTQMQMDAEVDRLCAKDGGLKIYETVPLPPEKFNEYNQINFFRATQDENALGPDYIWKDEETFLQPGGDPKANPRLRREHYLLYRRSDGKLLGESISYRRDGGDPRWWVDYAGGHGTDYVCPKNGVAGSVELLDNVFIKNDARRAK